MKKLISALVAGVALVWAAPALASHGAVLFGGATLEANDVKLVSNTGDAEASNNFSGIRFPVSAGLTFAGLTELRTQFNVTDDDCAWGSPRFQVAVDLGGGNVKNVFVYLGPSPTFTNCPQNDWQSSGNLVGTSDACRVDTSQISPGTQCTTWANAVALVGGKTVTGISIVVDAGDAFADKEQTVLIRNVGINGHEWFVPGAPQPGNQGNPAKLCKAQRDLIGPPAFNELWGKNANDRNAFGKCVSALAKAKKNGNLQAVQQAIITTAHTCMAEGARGFVLGACIAAHDGIAATKADPPNRGKKKGKR